MAIGPHWPDPAKKIIQFPHRPRAHTPLGEAVSPTGIPDSLERLSHTDLIGVVRELIGEVGRLRTENEKLSGALTKLKVEHQAVKDELARLKNLPPRPPQKPSGMDKATDRGVSGGAGAKSPAGEKSSRRRGSQLDKLTIDATVVVRAKAPAGSRHKGYEEIVVQDLNLSPQVTLYCRERWETPEGGRIIAALDPGIGRTPSSFPMTPASFASASMRCAGFTPNASSTSWFPPTTSSATPSRSPSG